MEATVETRQRRSAATVALAVVGLSLALAWTFTLRPESLGGPADYVMVQGISMEPTFHTGDLIVVWQEDSYRIGDVVAYRVPEGDVGAGSIVIHRIVGGSARSGFVVRGDNNAGPDDWRPLPSDILGKARFRIPALGKVLAFLHAPLPLASLAAGIAVALMVVPGNKRQRRAGGAAWRSS
jgi:signal peptidase